RTDGLRGMAWKPAGLATVVAVVKKTSSEHHFLIPVKQPIVCLDVVILSYARLSVQGTLRTLGLSESAMESGRFQRFRISFCANQSPLWCTETCIWDNPSNYSPSSRPVESPKRSTP